MTLFQLGKRREISVYYKGLVTNLKLLVQLQINITYDKINMREQWVR